MSKSLNSAIATAVDDGRPTVQELRGDNPLTQAAKRWWLRQKPAKFNPQLLKSEVYDVLEREGFGYKALLVLENLQFLEKWLWPNFSDEASDYHVIMITQMINVKKREGVPVWNHVADPSTNFSALFRRVLPMCLDKTYPLHIRIQLLSFVVNAFQSLDSGHVRKECASLVSISIWHNLSSDEARNEKLEKYTQTKKAWKAAGKRYEASDDSAKTRLKFERTWLYQMTLDLINLMNGPTPEDASAQDVVTYCERYIEFLTDLESQLPTRRYVNSLLKDLNVLTAIKLSQLYNESTGGFLRELHRLLEHYVYFSIDDITGEQLSKDEFRSAQNARLAKLQRIAFTQFKEKLTLLALANFGSIGQRDELAGHLNELTDEELARLCARLGLRTVYPKSAGIVADRAFLTEVMLCSHERRKTFQDEAEEMSVLPNERTLLEAVSVGTESYDGTRPLPIPKLNLQYLTVGDFLWRSFTLYRHEAFFGIRRDIEDALKRLSPKIRYPSMETTFHGFSKMALIVGNPSILEVLPPRVGEEKPASVRAEVNLDLSRVSRDVQAAWEGLLPDDVVFLLGVKGADDTDRMITNGTPARLSLAEEYGIKCLRAATVVQAFDSQSRPLRQGGQAIRGSGGQCRLHVNLDAHMYKLDDDDKKAGKPDIYETINVIVRRKGRENNFKSVLESIQELTKVGVPMPVWLQEVFLGYGDPAGATNLPDLPKKLDFRDTFLDWGHLVESFPGKTIFAAENNKEGCDPPYVLTVKSAPAPAPAAAPRQSRKRRREVAEPPAPQEESYAVSTYKLPNMGPYPTDQVRKNGTRYTPTQIDAIRSGMNPGLTVVVGPPGTGKTDVAVQIISNLYHNFPDERVLLIAHSNQALNQLFEKITKLDIDERHLLRLGHGEEGLSSGASFSKKGRVESFMDNRSLLLVEVDRLAACMEAPGAHGDSCETASYFNDVYILPAWAKFEEVIEAPGLTVAKLKEAYPFNNYFFNAPAPIFPDSISLEDSLEVARGGYRHIQRIFSELEDIRPFELLKTPRERQNYLLTKEARVIAMTSTHAAIKRREISKLGFRYDTLIIEESAQITEIETIIPFSLQSTLPRSSPSQSSFLKRLILLGDHHQNAPILTNHALKQHSIFDQSLFLRLVRLSVPIITLTHQGRARPEIADLYAWRYSQLLNLPHTLQFPPYNPGFAETVQFVDVPDYKGQGESFPTPHFLQNLGEAEYAVALYQYMRLLDYPREAITILTPYAGQRALIREVLGRRCIKNPVFGSPRAVTTVDKYQGEQNEYVILSLVRTAKVGYLRDLRRMTVALSRARLGLYVLGRREVFEACVEIGEAVARLKGMRLRLVTGEMYTGSEGVKRTREERMVEMHSVEHLGEYVLEMTKTKVEDFRRRRLVGGAGVVGSVVETDEEEGGVILTTGGGGEIGEEETVGSDAR